MLGKDLERRTVLCFISMGWREIQREQYQVDGRLLNLCFCCGRVLFRYVDLVTVSVLAVNLAGFP